ncbi:MAG TPA: fibronectin type III domain-containing protein [Tepidisphaeraceae bacterium]|nr:fibronectin type III domain-containing protein [Tepidisphaeraceae bacterium]
MITDRSANGSPSRQIARKRGKIKLMKAVFDALESRQYMSTDLQSIQPIHNIEGNYAGLHVSAGDPGSIHDIYVDWQNADNWTTNYEPGVDFAIDDPNPANNWNLMNWGGFYDDNTPNNQPYHLTIVVTDNDQNSETYYYDLPIGNVNPTAAINASDHPNEHTPATVSLNQVYDPSQADTSAGFHYSFALTENALESSYTNADTDGSHNFTFDDNGTYTVWGRVLDKDGGYNDYSTEVVVVNVAPYATLDFGPPVSGQQTVSLIDAIDNSIADTSVGFKYAFGTSQASLPTTYANASSTNSFTFNPTTISSDQIWARIFDRDGSYRDYKEDLPALAAQTASANQVNLTWSDPGTAEEHWLIQISTDGNNFTDLDTLPANGGADDSYNATGLVDGIPYHFRVRAVGTPGSIPVSDTFFSPNISATTFLASATRVIARKIDATGAGTLIWQDNSGSETGYRIYRSTNGSDFDEIGITDPNATSFDLYGLAANSNYTFKVEVFNSNTPAVSSIDTPLIVTSANNLIDESSDVRFEWNTSQNSTAHQYLTIHFNTAITTPDSSDFLVTNMDTGAAIEVTASTTGQTVTLAFTGGTLPDGNYQLEIPAGAIRTTNNVPLAQDYMFESSDGFYVLTGDANHNRTVDATDLGIVAHNWQGTNKKYGEGDFNYDGTVDLSDMILFSQKWLTSLPLPGIFNVWAFSSDQINLSWDDTIPNELGWEIDRSSDGTTFSARVSLPANTRHFEDTELEPGQRYWYRVRALSSENAEIYTTSIKSAATALQGPFDLEIANLTSTSLTLNWSMPQTGFVPESDEATEFGFQVLMKTDNGAFAVIDTTDWNEQTYDVTGLSSSHSYTFQIQFYRSQALGYVTSVPTLPFGLEVNPLPTDLQAVPIDSSSINLTWTDNSAFESQFIIERSLNGTDWDQIDVVPPNTTSYVDNDPSLVEGTTYQYRVRAVVIRGETSNSNTADTTTRLADPNSLSGEATSDTSITLAWADNSNQEIHYIIEQVVGISHTVIQTLDPNTTEATITGLNPNTSYIFAVFATDGNQTSNSQTISIKTDRTGTIPDAPSDLSFTSPNELGWTDNSTEETGFKVERRDGPRGDWQAIATLGSDSTSYTDGSMASDHTYYYRVIAIGTAGDSEPTDPVVKTTALSAPTSLTGLLGNSGEVDLSWMDNSTNELAFHVYHLMSGTSEWVLDADVPGNDTTGTTQYTVTGLENGIAYTFRVTAFTDDLESSEASLTGSITPLSTGISTSGDSTVTLSDPLDGPNYELTLQKQNISASLTWTIDWGDDSAVQEIEDSELGTGGTVTHFFAGEEGTVFEVRVNATDGTQIWTTDILSIMATSGASPAAGIAADDYISQRRAILLNFQNVYNQIKFEPYYGLKKGAIATQETKSGNDWDQAALLKHNLDAITIASSTHISSQYVFGIIRVPTKNVIRWLGVRDTKSAANVLRAAGLFVVPLDSNGQVSTTINASTQYLEPIPVAPTAGADEIGGYMYLWHTWLRVQVPDDSGTLHAWDLDPSWKYLNIRDADLNSGFNSSIHRIGLSNGTAFDESLTRTVAANRADLSPLEKYKTQITNYLSGSEFRGHASLADIAYDGPIIAKNFISAANKLMKYSLAPVQTEYSTILFQSGPATYEKIYTADDQAQVNFASGLKAMSHRLRVTVQLKSDPSKVAQAAISLYAMNGPVTIQATSHAMDPTNVASGELRIDILVGSTSVANTTISVSSDTENPAISVTIERADPLQVFGSLPTNQVYNFDAMARDPVALMIDAGEIGIGAINSLQAILNNDVNSRGTATPSLIQYRNYESNLVDLIAMKYAFEYEQQTQELAALAGVRNVKTNVSLGIVKGVNPASGHVSLDANSKFQLQNPYSFYDLENNRGITVNLPGLIDNVLPLWSEATNSRQNTAFQGIGYIGSWLESFVLEETTNTQSVSTVEGFQWATANNIPIRTLNSSSPSSAIDNLFTSVPSIYSSLSSFITTANAVRNLIRNEINSGGTVVVADGVINVGSGSNQWAGLVWSDETLIQPGAAGAYFIQQLGQTNPDSGGSSTGLVRPIGNSTSDQSTLNGIFAFGDPVNPYTGALYHDETDISLPTPGLPLTFSRHYDSSNAGEFGLGTGWTFTYGDRITTSNGTVVTWATSDGDLRSFIRPNPSAVQYLNPSGVFGIFKVESNGYTYTDKDKTVYTFTVVGRGLALLTKITDRNQNHIDIAVTSGKITAVTYVSNLSPNDKSMQLKFAYGSYGISSITDPFGRIWSYTVDSNHHLTLVKDPSPTSSSVGPQSVYQYYSNGLLYKIGRNRDNAGTLVSAGNYTYNYYPNGRVFSTTDPNNKSEFFSYDLFKSSLESTTGQLHTSRSYHTDVNGNTTEEVFDSNGLLTRTVNPDGSRVDQQWIPYDTSPATTGLDASPGFLLRSRANEDGLWEWFNYDGSIKGTGASAYFSGTSGNIIAHVTNSAAYQVGGNQPSDGIATTYTYDPAFNGIKTETIGSGSNLRRTTYGYDPHGNLQSVTQNNNAITKYTYDPAGRLLTQTNPNGNTTGIPDPNYTTTYTYSMSSWANGVTVTKVEPLASGTSATSVSVYDGRGNLLKITDPANRFTRYIYDNLDRKLYEYIPVPTSKLVNGDVPVSTPKTSFGWNDNLLRETDKPRVNANGTSVIEYVVNSYDSVGNLTQVQTTDLTTKTTVNTSYDALGNIISATNPLGIAVQSIYDSRGRMIETFYDDGTFELFLYDGAGNLVSDSTPSSYVYGYRLDPVSTTQTSYNTKGWIDSIVDPVGQTTVYAYSSFGQITDKKFFSSTNTGAAPWQWTHYNYDSVGRVADQRDLSGLLTTHAYDLNSNEIQQVDYDVTNITTPSGVPITSTSAMQSFMNLAANDAKITTDPHRTSSTRYDFADRPVMVQDNAGYIARTDYDAVGRVTATVDPRGMKQLAVTAPPTGAASSSSFWGISVGSASKSNSPSYATVTNYDFDSAGRARITKSLPNDNASSFTDLRNRIQDIDLYNVDGSLMNETIRRYASNGTTSSDFVTNYSYDLAGRKTTRSQTHVINGQSTPQTEITTYDAAGNIVTIQNSVAVPIVNSSGVVASWSTPTNQITSYKYDTRGRLIQKIDQAVSLPGLGLIPPLSNSIPDSNGNIRIQSLPAEGYTIDSLDSLGRATTSSRFAGNPPSTIISGRTTSFDSTGAITITYLVDGNIFSVNDTVLIGRTIPTSGGSYTLDPTSIDAEVVTGVNTTTHSITISVAPSADLSVLEAGAPLIASKLNFLTRSSSTYQNNNLSTTTDGNQNVTTYTYDKSGHQIAASVGGTQLWSKVYNGFGELVSETDFTGMSSPNPATLKTSYTYDSIGRLAKRIDPPAGSVVRATSFGYDAVGNQISETDPQGNVTTYTYDAQNRRTSEKLPGNPSSTRTVFNDYANSTVVTDPANNSITYTYDDFGNLVSEIKDVSIGLGYSIILGAKQTYFYDSIGNLTESIDRNGAVKKFEYDGLNRQLTEKWFTTLANAASNTIARTFTNTYDLGGKLTSADDSATFGVDSTYIYDDLGNEINSIQLVTNNTSLSTTVTVASTYDANRNRIASGAVLGSGGSAQVDFMCAFDQPHLQ